MTENHKNVIGAKTRKRRIISMAGVEGLRPQVMQTLHEILNCKDDKKMAIRAKVACDLLPYMFYRKEKDDVVNKSELDRLAAVFGQALVSVAGAGRTESNDSKVDE